jgi:diguanylate cyclase (GGDEF)-like protein/PAS domain S-box-containing protein
MQGHTVDVVRLGLLVLFLWAQQRRHPHRYLRFWMVGWVSVFVSYVLWDLQGVATRWLELQDALGFDFMLLGVLIFVFSLLPKLDWSQRMLQVGVVLGAVGVAIINVQDFVRVPRLVLALMVLMWQGDGLFIASKLLTGKLARMRKPILAICVLYGFAMMVYVTMTPAKDLDDWAVAQVLLCAAVLNWYGGKKGSVARWVGTIGFVLWAGFYFAGIVLVDPTPAQKLLAEFWSFPKYAVAAPMILKIFEDAKDEQARMAEQFRELYEDFRSIYESHPHPMWICDGETGKFLMANAATLAVYGYSIEELKGMRMSELVAPTEEGAEAVEEELDAAAEGTRLRHWHKDGRVVWVNVVDREIAYLGKKARFVVVHDITKRLKLDMELTHRAQHDVLTGLPNRQLLKDRLEQCMIACERDQRRAAILTIDIDHFKLINDTHGHLVGDECLQVVADRLKSKIRKVDTIARTGGEEFMAVVSGLNDVVDAEKVAASLLRVFETPLELSIGKLPVTVSIGVAVYPDDAMDVETLKRLSDEALYRAKRGGRNRAAYAFEVRARQYAI